MDSGSSEQCRCFLGDGVYVHLTRHRTRAEAQSQPTDAHCRSGRQRHTMRGADCSRAGLTEFEPNFRNVTINHLQRCLPRSQDPARCVPTTPHVNEPGEPHRLFT